MMNSSPSVVLKSKFIASGAGSSKTSFNNYINYMDRAETKNSEYESYNVYMENEEKSTGLFTASKDFLTKEEREKHKELFKESQQKGSIMWQDVISFDNDWLKEIGVLNGNSIDEKRLKSVTRETMNQMMKNEGISDSGVWTAAIHYNTDNIHIHMATVQTHNFKERGKRKPKTLEKMKSNVLNRLIDRSKENEKINTFIRKNLVETKELSPTNTLRNKITNRDMVQQFKLIYTSLPEDKRQWKYNMNSMKETRPEIDKLTDMFIEKNFSKEYSSFKKEVEKNVEFYKKTYGNNSQAELYKAGVYQDMYSRMGNTILTEMKEFNKKNNPKYQNNFAKHKHLKNKIELKRNIDNSLYQVNGYAKDELQSLKNQRAFEQLEQEKDFER